MQCLFTHSCELSYTGVLAHIVYNIYRFFHDRYIGLSYHIQCLLIIGIYKLEPKLAAVVRIRLLSDLFQFKEMHTELIGKNLVRALYHCRNFRMIITSGKHIEIDYIYSYRLLQLTVILAAFQLGRIQLCPIEKRSVTVIRIVFHLYLNIHKPVVHSQAKIKPAEFARNALGRHFGIIYHDLGNALRRNVEHTRHKGLKQILIIRKKLLKNDIQLCRYHISSHRYRLPLFTAYIIPHIRKVCNTFAI